MFYEGFINQIDTFIYKYVYTMYRQMKYTERIYWNQRTYGEAIKIPKYLISSLLLITCIVTPFTNWMIPLIGCVITRDFYIRYEKHRRI